MQWFRVYASMRHDPKVQMLSDEMYRALTNLWCLACENDGQLPNNSVISFELRMRIDKVNRVLNTLISAGLIDQVGDHLEPHNWSKRQYKSDTSNERVARYRERHRSGSVTLQETLPETLHVTGKKRPQSTEYIESSIEESSSLPLGSIQISRLVHRDAPRPSYSEEFEEFWKAYPKREGPNPKAPAAKRYEAALKSGASAAAILSSTRRFSADCKRRQEIGTRFIPHAATWLSQMRWIDYQRETSPTGNGARPPPTEEELAIRKRMIEEGAKHFDEFGNLKPY